jgi:hypothetical protein
MENFDNLLDTKNEFTIHLCNILSPMVYEGIQSIYLVAKGTSTEESEILKNFQDFLKKITEWTEQKKITETNRILSCSKCSDWLEILIKAVIKANIVLLSATKRKNALNDKSYYQNLDMNKFIHQVYLECARTFFNNPFLFYHNYSSIDIKRNQRDSIKLIKECIKEAIRKTLPIKKILENYINEDIQQTTKKDSEIIENTIKQFLEYKKNKDEENNYTLNSKFKYDIKNSETNQKTKSSELKKNFKSSEIKNTDNKKSEIKNSNSKNTEQIMNLVNDSESDKAILNMINKSNLKINDGESNKNTPKSEKKQNTNNDSETSISYTGGQWGDDNFEAVFSNTNTNPIHINNTKKNAPSHFFLN